MKGKSGDINFPIKQIPIKQFLSTLGVVILFNCLIFSFGCARTVTQIVPYGKQMTVEVTLRGTWEVESSRYYLVLSNSSDLRVPLPPPQQLPEAPEFIEPGMTPQLGSTEAYYRNFFSSWAGYVVMENGGFFAAKGPFIQGQVVSREVFANLKEASNKITFTLDLSQIFDTLPDTIYFDFVTVDWPDSGPKIPQDHLTSTNAYISTLSGSSQSVDDPEEEGVSAPLNILNCRVVIQ